MSLSPPLARRRASRASGCLLPAATLLLLAVMLGLGLFLKWDGLKPEDRVALELAAAGVLDEVREAPGVPLEVRRGLDGLLDRIPAHVGPTVRSSWVQPADSPVFGGDPRPTDGRSILVLENRGYRAGWDVEAGAPAWAAFRVFRTETRHAPERPDSFRVDPRVPAAPPPGAWENSGYDRGHLAPSRAIGIAYGDTAQEETFLVTNLVPQLPELNRGLWRRLEARQVDRLAFVLDEIWIVVGPLHEGVRWRRRLGADGPPVPDHLFTVMLDRRPDGALRSLALRVPQRPPGKPSPNRYLVAVDAVEVQARLDLFPELPMEEQVPLESMVPARLW